MTLKELLALVAGCGGRIEVEYGRPRLVTPAEPYFRARLEELAPELGRRRDEVMEHFAGTQRAHDRAEMLEAMHAADGRCAAAGGVGAEPGVAGAAALVASAWEAGDLESLRAAVAEFDVAVRAAVRGAHDSGGGR